MFSDVFILSEILIYSIVPINSHSGFKLYKVVFKGNLRIVLCLIINQPVRNHCAQMTFIMKTHVNTRKKKRKSSNMRPLNCRRSVAL